MGGEIRELTAAEAASALGWWLEAGVDSAVAEEPRDWLSLRPAPAPEAAPKANISEPAQETLAEMREWLASSLQLPLASASARRILPHGPENAPVMLLSDAPTLEDFTSGQPVGGEAWVLATKMLAAIGIDAEKAYSASLSCFHAPGARLDGKDREACAEIARRHIRLARPQRLLLLGDGPCRALLGKGLAAARGHVHRIEGVRAVATFHPRQLLQNPGQKALAWRDLLLLMEDEA